MERMKDVTLFLCLLAGMLTTTHVAAQEVVETSFPAQQGGATYMGYRVEKGDTVYYDSMNPIWVFPRGRRGKSDLKS